MIKLEEFLLKNIYEDEVGCYALVTYNDIVEATWFTNYCNLEEDEIFYLESPCQLFKICEVGNNIDKFCKEYMENINLLEGTTEENSEKYYIENFVKPMIVDGWFYQIENFQVAPYLPKEVTDIKLISERECLEWLLKQ